MEEEVVEQALLMVLAPSHKAAELVVVAVAFLVLIVI
jgi:hypothetical protein